MAGKKKTVETTEVVEETKANEVPVTEEITETPVEETVEKEGEEVSDNEDATEEVEINEEEIGEERDEETVSDLKVNELVTEFSNPEKNIEELINNNPENIEGAVNAEIERVTEIAEKVKNEIKKSEATLDTKKRNFKFDVAEYWNGVSDGWSN